MATTPPAEGDTGFSSRRAAPDLLAHTQPEPEPDASDGHPDIDLVALEADVALKKTLSAPHPKPKAGDGLGGSPPAGELSSAADSSCPKGAYSLYSFVSLEKYMTLS